MTVVKFFGAFEEPFRASTNSVSVVKQIMSRTSGKMRQVATSFGRSSTDIDRIGTILVPIRSDFNGPDPIYIGQDTAKKSCYLCHFA